MESKRKTVKNIYDIPNIDRYMNEDFVFQTMTGDDGEYLYHYTEGLTLIEICLIVEYEPIQGVEKLQDIVTLNNLEYFSFDEYFQGEFVRSYHYTDHENKQRVASIAECDYLIRVLGSANLEKVVLHRMDGQKMEYHYYDRHDIFKKMLHLKNKPNSSISKLLNPPK